MNIICKKENSRFLFYNLTTDTWEIQPQKATLIKDTEVACNLRNILQKCGKGDGIVKNVSMIYIYNIWTLGGDAKAHNKTIRVKNKLNEKEQEKAIVDFCNEIIEKYNINLHLWGINYIRKEYEYGTVQY